MSKQNWQIEAQRRSDAKANLHTRADDLPTGITRTQAIAQQTATQAEWNKRGKPTLNDAAQALRDTATLSPDHPDRKKAIADYEDAKSRGDSLDVRTDARDPRHTYDPKTGTGFDSRPWVKLADGTKVPAAMADQMRGDSKGERAERRG